MIVAVEVGVALARPPRHDATMWVLVDAATDTEARLIACQIAGSTGRGVVMVISADVIDTLEI